MGARNRVGIGLSYRPARLHRLAGLIPCNRSLGSLQVKKFGLCKISVDYFVHCIMFYLRTGKNESIPGKQVAGISSISPSSVAKNSCNKG
jgi:hypothetical protein